MAKEFYSKIIKLQSRGKNSSVHGGLLCSHTAVLCSVRLYLAKQSATLFWLRWIFCGINSRFSLKDLISTAKWPSGERTSDSSLKIDRATNESDCMITGSSRLKRGIQRLLSGCVSFIQGERGREIGKRTVGWILFLYKKT